MTGRGLGPAVWGSGRPSQAVQRAAQGRGGLAVAARGGHRPSEHREIQLRRRSWSGGRRES